MRIPALLFCALLSPSAFAQEPTATAAQIQTVRIEGTLYEKGTKRPLSDVNLFLLPAKLKATTDPKGNFVFDAAPVGEAQIVVNATGYRKLESQETIAQGDAPRKLYLERASYQGLEATVVGKVQKRDEAVRSLKTEQFLTMPGSGGDPVKAVQNLPGVARVQGFSSQVVIQGSAPQDTAYLFEEHPVPLVFHFGGLTSVITPEAVDQVDYLSAGYGPEYGRAMGGLVSLRTRNPTRERRKGFVFADTIKAGFLLEAPIDERSEYLITGRYSYLGFVLKQAVKDNPQFDLTVAPAFADLSLIYHTKPTDQDDVKVTAIASRDELKFLLKEPAREDPAVRGNFSTETSFYRLIPQWTRRFDGNKTGRLSLGVGQDVIKIDIGENYFDLKSYAVTQRGEWEQNLGDGWTSYLGMDNQFNRATVRLRLPTFNGDGGVNNPISSSETIELDVTQDDIFLGPYWRNKIKVSESKWTLMPNTRLDYFKTTKEVRPQPRLSARYDVDETFHYKTAAGLYVQPPEPQETAESIGNPDLRSPQAWHFTVGGEKDLREGTNRGFVVSSNLFYKLFEHLVINSSSFVTRDGVLVPERYNNEGTGKAYGAEFLIRYDGKPWEGWIAYTLSRSFRTEPNTGERVFRYDQTHNLNVVGSYEADNNWKYSARARFVTGNPVTPIIGGSFDADNDVFIPRRGPIYSERLDPFFQIDVRADKKWIYDTWILWGYIDIQNVTNQKNPESIRYSYDYSQKTAVTGLPVLPTIGVRGEF